MTTRFRVPIHVKDGDVQKTLVFDLDNEGDALILPPEGTPLLVYEGVKTWVKEVTLHPTQDPTVLVDCRPLFADDLGAMNVILNEAAAQEGWRVVG